MINSLKNIFNKGQDSKIDNDYSALDLLVGLMIEAANIDGSIDKIEVDNIKLILKKKFNENEQDINNSINKTIQKINNMKSLHFFTSNLNKKFDYDKKLLIVETIWQIILSDEKIDDYESNLISRISGLLYISDVDAGNAKKRALIRD